MQYQQVPQGKNPQLWQLAHKRTSFKKHLVSYIVLNLFFWILWYCSKGMYEHSYEYGYLHMVCMAHVRLGNWDCIS